MLKQVYGKECKECFSVLLYQHIEKSSSLCTEMIKKSKQI